MGSNTKIGLVLEGGAMRGLFSAGVIDVLMENDIYTDGAIGVSAGAVFGCNYKSRQIGRALRYNLRFCKEPRYCGIRSFIKTGDLYGGDFCYRVIPEKLDKFDWKTFSESDMEFYIVCTDVETGTPLYHKCTNGGEKDLQWMRASASMPLVSKVIHVDGYEMQDGGMSDPIPLKYFQGIGYKKNIVILTQPRDYKKHKSKMDFAYGILLHKYPNLVKSMKKRPILYNQTLDYIYQEEKKGEIIVIAPPSSLPIGKIEHDSDRMRIVYHIGRKTALESLNDIKSFIDSAETKE